MNPTLSPYPNQQPSPFFSAIPNPNPYVVPNPSHHNPFPHNPPPSVALPAAADLSTTISTLKSLIDLSHQTLTSISKFLPLNLLNDGLVQCPYNPNHRMPPESLFGHYLRCPTSLDLSTVVESLCYPKTLKSSEEAVKDNHVVQTLGDQPAQHCFTLDGYSDFMSNIFYSDCPGVVTFPCKEDAGKRTFILPGFLSIECANFGGQYSGEVEGAEKDHVQIFPSELWGIESEIGTWNDCPIACSQVVLRAIVGLQNVKDCDLGRWVITNSPRFGVVLDVAMSDHISLLFGICLKAIVREALNLLKRNMGVKENLDCPILVQATMWLASHLSVLYSEMQGKCFTLDLLKKSILDAASHISLYPYEEKMVDSSDGKENSTHLAASHGVKASLEMEEGEVRTAQTVYQKNIFVSQVVAAVAALQERSLFEQKIRALRQLQPLPRYQRVVEHTDISTRAAEERKKRPTYKPIIDHDGLPRQALSMQETGKTKTREELLAEERDYKRRRMSYRGKKSKRNPSEVVRDIIEEFMEEIKQAGGIGCFEKGAEIKIMPPGPPSFHDQRKNNIAKERGANSSVTQDKTDSDARNDIPLNGEQNRRLQGNFDDSHRRERHDMEVNRNKSRKFESSSSVRSSSRNDFKEDDWKSKSRDKWRRRNEYVNVFEDRYDPSRSDD